jgi:hypothetical protein
VSQPRSIIGVKGGHKLAQSWGAPAAALGIDFANLLNTPACSSLQSRIWTTNLLAGLDPEALPSALGIDFATSSTRHSSLQSRIWTTNLLAGLDPEALPSNKRRQSPSHCHSQLFFSQEASAVSHSVHACSQHCLIQRQSVFHCLLSRMQLMPQRMEIHARQLQMIPCKTPGVPSKRQNPCRALHQTQSHLDVRERHFSQDSLFHVIQPSQHLENIALDRSLLMSRMDSTQ